MPEQPQLVDYEFGLKQLGGNAKLLNKMLGKFKDQFVDSPSYVEQKVKEGDFEQAKMKVHTAKGITGNLGLNALFSCCKALEVELKQASAPPPLMAEFSELMTATIASIDELSENAESVTEARVSEINPNAKEELKELLTRHEFIEDTLLQDLVASLDLSKDEKLKIIDLIEQLQYDQAYAMIKG